MDYPGRPDVITIVLKRERQREISHTQRRRQCDHGDRDWGIAATSQGMPAAIRSWKRQERILLLEPLEVAALCQHPDVGLVILILDFWLPEG